MDIKRALPYIAIGLGALLVLLALRNLMASRARGGLQVSNNMAPNYAAGADMGTQYGTQTASGIPFYDQYQDKHAAPAATQVQNPAACVGVVTGNMNMTDFNADPMATCPSIAGNVRKLYGCLDKASTTWNPHANTHDQRFCQYPTAVAGCADRGAVNYNPSATVNDGSCVAARVGCMDVMAANFDAQANVPCEGCCVPNTFGCTQKDAPNYQPTATMEDGSCIRETVQRVMPAQATAPEEI